MLKNITQFTLLRRIHALSGPDVFFHLCHPLSRLAKYQLTRKHDRMGSLWTGIWNEGEADPAPCSVTTESFGILINANVQGDEWLPICTQTGLLEVAPIKDVTMEDRRISALVARNCSSSSRGDEPY